MAGKKSYGTVISRAGVVLGEIVKVNVPEVLQEAADTTNMSSSGWKTAIPSGLKSVEPFEITILAGSAVFSTIYTDFTGETTSVYQISYAGSALSQWSFSAFPVSVKVGDMDASKPEAMQLIVKLQASGSLSAS